MSGDKYVYGCTNCVTEIWADKRNLEGSDCIQVFCKGKLIPKRVDSFNKQEEIITHAKYTCFTCGHNDLVTGKRKDYQELRLCPCCNGLYVDIWKIDKYKHLKNEEIKGRCDKPYLQITLDELNSVPKVIYKGEEIKLKQEVIFHWETDTDEFGGTTIEIEHAEASCKYQKSKRIEERIKSHRKF